MTEREEDDAASCSPHLSQASDTTEKQLREDPYNQWFGRQSRYRMPAEMVRDNVLSVSNLLVHTVGGSSVKPMQPTGYYRHLNFPKRVYTPHLDQRQYRRGVYVHWQRQFLHPMLKDWTHQAAKSALRKGRDPIRHWKPLSYSMTPPWLTQRWLLPAVC